ncbi:MAG: hypothetical protein WC284_09680 [Candidimonas sp.]
MIIPSINSCVEHFFHKYPSQCKKFPWGYRWSAEEKIIPIIDILDQNYDNYVIDVKGLIKKSYNECNVSEIACKFIFDLLTNEASCHVRMIHLEKLVDKMMTNHYTTVQIRKTMWIENSTIFLTNETNILHFNRRKGLTRKF